MNGRAYGIFNLSFWTNTRAVEESVCYAHGSHLPAAFTLIRHELVPLPPVFLSLSLPYLSSTALSL